MSVCQTVTFESLNIDSLYSAQLVYLQGIWVKFVYEGPRVKVMVTGAKKVENPHSPQCKASMSNNSGSINRSAMKFASSMGFSAMTDRVV